MKPPAITLLPAWETPWRYLGLTIPGDDGPSPVALARRGFVLADFLHTVDTSTRRTRRHGSAKERLFPRIIDARTYVGLDRLAEWVDGTRLDLAAEAFRAEVGARHGDPELARELRDLASQSNGLETLRARRTIENLADRLEPEANTLTRWLHTVPDDDATGLTVRVLAELAHDLYGTTGIPESQWCEIPDDVLETFADANYPAIERLHGDTSHLAAELLAAAAEHRSPQPDSETVAEVRERLMPHRMRTVATITPHLWTIDTDDLETRMLLELHQAYTERPVLATCPECGRPYVSQPRRTHCLVGAFSPITRRLFYGCPASVEPGGGHRPELIRRTDANYRKKIERSRGRHASDYPDGDHPETLQLLAARDEWKAQTRDSRKPAHRPARIDTTSPLPPSTREGHPLDFG